jgi:hypothetical protein
MKPEGGVVEYQNRRVDKKQRQSDWEENVMIRLNSVLAGLALAAIAVVPAHAQYMDENKIAASAAKATGFPSGPIDFVCTTSPGSSVAVWCQNLARGFSDELGVPVEVQYKSGGSQHEPVLRRRQAGGRAHHDARQRQLLRLFPPAALHQGV